MHGQQTAQLQCATSHSRPELVLGAWSVHLLMHDGGIPSRWPCTPSFALSLGSWVPPTPPVRQHLSRCAMLKKHIHTL